MRRKKSEKGRRYVNIFNDLGVDWEAIVDARDSDKEVDFIEDVIPRKGMILDLCCGTGRHSIALSQRRRNVVGLDLSRSLLMIAKSRMKDAGTAFESIRADMRFLPLRDRVFSSVLSMFTSFGYLPSESEDALSLLEINRCLGREGRFVLDLGNRDHMVRGFRERDWAEYDPFYMLEKRSFDLKTSTLSSQWTLIRKNSSQARSIQHTVRLFTFIRAEQLLNEAGLCINDVYGGYEKQDFTLEASRMIVIAQKLG